MLDQTMSVSNTVLHAIRNSDARRSFTIQSVSNTVLHAIRNDHYSLLPAMISRMFARSTGSATSFPPAVMEPQLSHDIQITR